MATDPAFVGSAYVMSILAVKIAAVTSLRSVHRIATGWNAVVMVYVSAENAFAMLALKVPETRGFRSATAPSSLALPVTLIWSAVATASVGAAPVIALPASPEVTVRWGALQAANARWVHLLLIPSSRRNATVLERKLRP